MELGHAYSVLVVSASAKFNESVRGLLPERFYWPVTVLTDAAGARRELLENSCDLVVINTPLPDEFGTRLAQDICQHSAAYVDPAVYPIPAAAVRYPGAFAGAGKEECHH